MRSAKRLPVKLAIVILCFFGCSKTENKQENKPKTLVVLGSSSAEGYGAFPIDSSWVNRITQSFRADNITCKTYNLAKTGYMTFHILPSDYPTADVDRNVDKALSFTPHLVIISLPSNDFARGFKADTVLHNFSIIIGKLLRANVPVILLSTQPRNFPTLPERRQLALFNDRLRDAFPGQFINVYNLLASTDHQTLPQYSNGDGIHLNNAGHGLIYRTVSAHPFFRRIFY